MKISHQQGDPQTLTLLEENARYMRHETFARLVANIKRDGVLQQWPFVYYNEEAGTRTVLSGNHRVRAAIDAGLDSIDWIECDEPLTEDQQRAIQLGHNAIVGEDDPEMLQRIYDSITDVEERLASGLDDSGLELMFQASTVSLSEVNLDFTTLTIVFLPDEFQRALTAFDEAKKLTSANRMWLARYAQHDAVLEAIEDARESSHVLNTATALDLLLDVWDAHREDLQKNWLADDDTLHCRDTDAVPVTSILGTTTKAKDAQLVVKAIRKMTARGEIQTPAEALTVWASNYLTEG